MSDLTTLAKVKNYLGITTSDHDTLLEYLITRMSTFIRTYCGRDFDQTTYTDDKYDGEYKNDGFLRLRHFPIISVTSLYDDTSREFTADTEIESGDYIIRNDEGIIQLLDGVFFNEDYQNIKITYVAGYSTIPEDLEQACIDLVGFKFNTRQSSGKRSERLGRWAVTYVTLGEGKEAIPSDTKAVLDRYSIRDMFVI